MKTKKVALPRAIGKHRFPQHPLVIGVTKATKDGTSVRQFALKQAGVSQQVMDEWLKGARKNRNYLLPPARALQFARMFKVPPAAFRPDLWASTDVGA